MIIFQHKNIIKPPPMQDFILSVIQFDKSFHPLVQYKNYLICIFININEKLKMREKNIRLSSVPQGNQTYIEHHGHVLMDDNSFNSNS